MSTKAINRVSTSFQSSTDPLVGQKGSTSNSKIESVGQKAITASARYFSKPIDGTKIDSRATAGDYQQVNNGKAKVVYQRVIQKGKKLELDRHYVVYRPRTVLHIAELNREVETAKNIKEKLQSLGITGETHIQTELTRRSDGGVDAPGAIGSLEDVIERDDLTMQDRFDLAKQVITGMKYLHQAGYVTGDAKLDNILVFRDPNTGKLIARFSDFGKTQKCGENGVLRVEGNVRYAGPEKVLTQRSERFSLGLMVLQILAPGLSRENFEKVEIENRKGIEGQLLRAGRPNHKGVLDYLGFWISYIIAVLTGDQSIENTERDAAVVSAYTHMLLSGDEENEDHTSILGAIKIVHELTRANPKERMSLEEAEGRFTELLPGSGVSNITRF